MNSNSSQTKEAEAQENKQNIVAMINKFEYFDLRKRFVAKSVEDNSGWTQSTITIFDTIYNKELFSYKRNYSLLKTFEPFRVWDNFRLEWRYFAVISENYMFYKVVDLMDAGKIVADAGYPKHSKESAEKYNEIFAASIEKNAIKPVSEGDAREAFCGAAFYIPDLMDSGYFDASEFESMENISSSQEYFTNFTLNSQYSDLFVSIFETFVERRTIGFVSGCMWGDDSSWKLRTFDLTNILSGEVGLASEKYFGYFQLMDNLSLQESISIDYFVDCDYPFFIVAAPIYVTFTSEDNNTGNSKGDGVKLQTKLTIYNDKVELYSKQ